MAKAMTRDELLGLPAATDLVTAARAVGIGKSKAYEMAASGEFPVPVLRLGKAYRVRSADLLKLLGITDTKTPAAADAGEDAGAA